MSASGIEADVVDSGTAGNDHMIASEPGGFADGGAGDDLLEGVGGSNFLSGGAGDDTMFSLQGDNVLDGGDGNDVAVYTGSHSDYEVEDQGFGIFAVKSGGRTDFLTDVETLRFDDGSFSLVELSGQAAIESADVSAELIVEVDPDPSIDVAAVLSVSEVSGVLAEPLSVAAPPVELTLGPIFDGVLETGDSGDNQLEGTPDDDWIDGAEGNDVIAGLGGDDLLNGGDGDDLIIGDNGVGNSGDVETVRESFEWDLAGVGDGRELNGFTQNTGNVDVTFSVLQETGRAETEFSNDLQKVHSIDADADPVNTNSSLDSELKGQGNQADYALEFSAPVDDVSFRVNDIDGDGIVRVTAFDADGNPISVNLQGGNKVVLSDTDGVAGNDTADSTGGYFADDNPSYSVLIDIEGPVSRIVIEHDQDGSQNSGINITDVYFDAPVAGSGNSGGTVGNDTIIGGAGDDVIYGDNQPGSNNGNSVPGVNLIQNGSFEDATGTDARGYGFVGKDGSIVGWTDANGADIDLHNNGRHGILATDGDNWLDLDASPANNLVGQDVAGVVDGDSYQLSFDLGDAATNVDNTDDDNTVTVIWGGEAIATIDPTDGVMESYCFDLIGGAGDGSNRLEFAGGGAADNIGASVDNVQLFAAASGNSGSGDGPGGDDTLIGGEGADRIYGQGGSDTIIGGNDGDFVDGGTEGSDFDVLDLRGAGPFQIINETIDADGDSTSGTIEFLDSLGNITGSLGFTEIEEIKSDPVNVGPNANDGVDTTVEDTEITVNLIANDFDVSGDQLTVTTATVPADQGTLVDNGDGTVTFTPEPDFNGDATITYSITDGNGGFDTAEHVVTVTSVNDAPVTVDDAATTAENTSVTIDVLDNDSDPDGDALVVSSASVPADQGTVEIVNNEVVYTPAPDFTGEATISYSAADPDGSETPGTAVVIVEAGPNDPPVAGDDAVTTAFGAVAYGNVAANDSDPNGDTLSYALLTETVNGTVSLNSLGTYTYTPDAGFSGQDSFEYTVSDGNGGTATATVTVTVEPELIVDPPAPDPGPVNQNPDAIQDFNQTEIGTSVDGHVLCNDVDPDGDALSATLQSGPENGTVTVRPDGSYTYVPNPGFSGTDTFVYEVSDGNGGTDTAEVTIEVGCDVNTGPNAVDDFATTQEDAMVSGTVAGNDSDPDGDNLTFWINEGPANGSIQFGEDGSYTYKPDPGFSGQDTFTYEVTDGNGGSSVATVTITVEPSINQDPEAVNDSNSTIEDQAVSGTVAGNDSDADGDDLTFYVSEGPANGSLTFNTDGSYTYTPDPGFSGQDFFTYEASDGNGGSDVAVVCITVDAVPNQGPDAVDDSNSTVEDQSVSGSVAGNDSDADGDTLTFYVADGPSNGSLTFDVDGSYTYTPDPGFSGQDSFTYDVSDGNGGSDTATVQIAVDAAPNQGPDAVDDSNSTIEAQSVSGTVSGNDSDADGDSLTFSIAGGPSNGFLSFNQDGSYTYTPNAGFTGQDSFTYDVSDGNGGSDTATVTISVDPAPNQGPDAVQDFNTTAYNTAVSGKVLCNDTDPDGDALAVELNTQPSYGTVTVTPGGSYVYTPNDGFSGQDTFTYTITDGNGGTDTATVTIEVCGALVGGESTVRNTIDATDDSFTTEFDTEVTGNVLTNDVDPDGDTLTATEMTDVRTSDGGTVSLFADGSFNYTPADGFTGVDTFVYESSDGNGNVTTATVRITVNEAPILAVDDGYTGETNETISGSVVINDVGVDSDVTVEVVEGPTNGTLTLNSDGTFTYLANDGFSGEDTFRYTLVDGASTSEANVRLVIAEVNYDTTYVGSGQDGLIWGDPHFRGDDGGFYDVTGEADRVYNLLSDSNLQLNAKFIYWQGEVTDGTVIGELGLTLGNDQLFVDLNGASLNGNDLPVGQFVMGNGTVDYDGAVTTINTGDYILELTRQDGLFAVRIKVIDPFSDLVAPHGLWGQTVDGDVEARDGDFYKDNFIYGLQGGGALDRIDANGNIVRTERGDLSSFELYETADIFSTKALLSEGDAFFRFDARQGTGLNAL